MWIDILLIISSTISLTAGLISIIQYTRMNEIIKKRGILVTILLLFFATSVVLGLYHLNNVKENEKIELKNTLIKNDAKIVVKSVTKYGDFGELKGYLTQIAGFYFRYEDKYPSECEEYKAHLKRWRDREQPSFSSEYEELKGLVEAGEKHLTQIAGLE